MMALGAGRGLTQVVAIHHQNQYQYPSACYSSCSRTYYYNIMKIDKSTKTKGNMVGNLVATDTFCCCGISTSTTNTSRRNSGRVLTTGLIAAAAAAILMFSSSAGVASAANSKINDPYAEGAEGTLGDIPKTLSGSGECVSSAAGATSTTTPRDCVNKGIRRIQRPKSKKAELCTRGCVTTCVRSGDGEGPLNAIRPLVVFKQGFRSRNYCLLECSDICNLMKENDEGP